MVSRRDVGDWWDRLKRNLKMRKLLSKRHHGEAS
jgi:hypothetical protein